MNKMYELLIVGGVALLVGLLLGWMVHGVTAYNTGTETVTASQDWRTACPAATAKDQHCEVVQDIVDGQSHNEIARVAFGVDASKKVMGITLPLGVALQPGIGLIFGTDPAKVFPYRTCNAQGCMAEVPLDDKIQASLNAGKDGRILFMGLDNKPAAVPLSLKGYADAQRVYRNNEAKRGSWFWRMW
jgi:invasion protein IalB